MPYSTKLCTPLSHMESRDNEKMTQDPAILVSFPLVGVEGKQGTSLVVYTTTPWTLPSNLLIAVHPDLEYVEVLDNDSGQKYILWRAGCPCCTKAKRTRSTRSWARSPASPWWAGSTNLSSTTLPTPSPTVSRSLQRPTLRPAREPALSTLPQHSDRKTTRPPSLPASSAPPASHHAPSTKPAASQQRCQNIPANMSRKPATRPSCGTCARPAGFC